MSEQVDVLEGIREIVQPVMPVLPDWSIYYIAVSISVAIILVLVMCYLYRKRSRVQAKIQYRTLKNNWSNLQAGDCGERIILILRLLLGQHNLSEKIYIGHDVALSQQEWEWLMAQSNQLRFSSFKKKPQDAINILPLIEKMIWPNR